MEKQVIQSVGFRNLYEDGRAVGFQLKIRLPYYRGVFLSQIKPGSLAVDGEVFSPGPGAVEDRRGDLHRRRDAGRLENPLAPLEPAVLVVKKEGGLAQGYHDIQYGFCCTHSYMPPFLESAADPDKPEMVYMPEMGHNLHQRRLLIV